MGVIRKQSIWGSIITYIGAILGFITTIIFFPRTFSTEQIGLVSIIVAYSTVLSTFASLGVHQVVGRFFPYFRNKEKNHNGFLFLLILVPFIGFLITLAISLFLQEYLIENSIDSSNLLADYIIYIIPFVFVILFFNVFDNYYKFLYNITLGSFLKEVLQRIVILFGIILFYFSFISFTNFLVVYLIAFTIPLIVIVLSLIHQKEFSLKPQFGFVSKSLRKSMITMGVYGIISSFAGIVIINVDKMMIERLMGLDDVGIYTIAFFFGMLIVLPSRPLLKISSAYIAEAWRNKDLELIKTIYRKSSINQFIIGLLLFIGIWSNINNIFEMLPDEYIHGKWVIFFIGLSYLTDMLTGTSPYILINSKYYKSVTYIMFVLIIIAIAMNFVFIPILGLIGAAIASLIAKIIANGLFVMVLYKKYKLFPLNRNHLLILGIGLFVFILNHFLPEIENWIIDIIYRSTIISIVFGGLIYFLKVSEDINETVKSILKANLKFKIRK